MIQWEGADDRRRPEPIQDSGLLETVKEEHRAAVTVSEGGV